MAVPGAKMAGPVFFGNDAAPFIYFDGAYVVLPVGSDMIIEVAARTLMPVALTPDAPLKMKPVTVGHLRCSVDVARQLRDSLNNALPAEEAKVTTSPH